MNDELVQYFIVNSELNMSSGKIATQVAHVASDITYDIVSMIYTVGSDITEKWVTWNNHDQPKIILRAKEKEMEKLIEQGWYFIRDIGRTEIPSNSLTCIGYYPEHKSIMRPIVKRFQLL
jgi:PTH2 family peptidyl-tRNA hydrolase